MEKVFNFDNEVSEAIKKSEASNLWFGKRYENAKKKITNGQKGHLGTRIVKKILQSDGHEVEKIHDEGDLRINGEHSEVKFCMADINKLKNGFITESLWWNQIRPQQEKWTTLCLVAMYPDFVRVYLITREQYFDVLKNMPGIVKGGHTSKGGERTDEVLEQISIVKNTAQNQISLLNEFIIYEG